MRGEGVYLFDDREKRYLDACGGAMVCNVGHGRREIADEMGRQAAQLAYVNGTAFTSEPVEELAALLATKTPDDLDRVLFLSSGSEAVEAALKLARQYHVERAQGGRQVVIAQTPGYHGNTLFALSASARRHYRAMFAPWLTDVITIEAPYPYRADERRVPDGSELEEAILRAGAENVAAFIAEPIGGSSTGASVPPASYFARVREICDRYGVLFICDEILTGSGRTGKYFGLEHFQSESGGAVVPDIITMGKGLNGGYAPLSAVIAKRAIVETIAAGSGNFMHAQTYSHHPVACAAGIAVQHYLERHDLVRRAAAVGAKLGEALRWVQAEGAGKGAEIVGDVRGIGMLWAMEFVADPQTKRPFSRSLKVAETIVENARGRGLILWPNVGQADGENGDLVMIAPPFTIEQGQIDEIADLLAATVRDSAEHLVSNRK